MIKIHWNSPKEIVRRLKSRLELIKIAFLSLTYNEHLSWNYAFDTLMEPAIWFIDTFCKFLGPLFVTGFMLLTSSAIFIAYHVGLPYYIQNKNPWYVALVVILGNYIKINVIFYYWNAFWTDPGQVPIKAEDIKTISTICKKCIHPKPPRTHHCSVCDRCILKMDHHCPWINGCIGHFNHRYFFMFMVSMVVGCFFIMLFGVEIFYQEVFYGESDKDISSFDLTVPRNMIFYEAFIITGTFFLLGGLMLWHAKLIHQGETSIEAHINKGETKRLAKLGKKYQNPYNFTPWYNWCLFLGMIGDRGWSCVLIPSKFPPLGSGLEWDTIFSCDIPWNDAFKPIDATKLA